MAQYLVPGYLPDDFDPSQADQARGREIQPLNAAVHQGRNRSLPPTGGRLLRFTTDWHEFSLRQLYS